jgi:hypothetical protein
MHCNKPLDASNHKKVNVNIPVAFWRPVASTFMKTILLVEVLTSSASMTRSLTSTFAVLCFWRFPAIAFEEGYPETNRNGKI